jgi:hypothetical protein
VTRRTWPARLVCLGQGSLELEITDGPEAGRYIEVDLTSYELDWLRTDDLLHRNEKEFSQ